MKGSSILDKAKAHLGETYVLGAHAPLENKGWTGPWDCAEYASWLVYQTYGIVYGCGTDRLEGADPYSGFWVDDAGKRGVMVTADSAAKTPGAFLVRRPVAQPVKAIGHVAIAIGDGSVYEAAGAKLGVRVGPIEGRRWDFGVLVPTVDYGAAMPPPVVGGPASPPDEQGSVPAVLILRRQASPSFDDHVVELQTALKQRGFDPGKIDGLFGAATEAAVFAFQLAEGELPDGEVGPMTGVALDLPYWPRPQTGGSQPLGGPAGGSAGGHAPVVLLTANAFGTVVDEATDFATIRTEYLRLFESCVVRDHNGEIADLCSRIADSRHRYETFVAGYAGKPNQLMPWFFVALLHAMEASGDIGRFKTHLHNGDPLTRPTTHVPKNRPAATGSNFSWEESARDAITLEGFDSESDWTLPRMLYRLEKYNGMGPRLRGHATAYLWSYSNHYVKGKFVADGVWSDDAVSRQPGAAAILKQLVAQGTVSII